MAVQGVTLSEKPIVEGGMIKSGVSSDSMCHE